MDEDQLRDYIDNLIDSLDDVSDSIRENAEKVKKNQNFREQEENNLHRKKKVREEKEEKDYLSRSQAAKNLASSMGHLGTRVASVSQSFGGLDDSVGSFIDALSEVPLIGFLGGGIVAALARNFDNLLDTTNRFARSGIYYGDTVYDMGTAAARAGMNLNEFGDLVTSRPKLFIRYGIDNFLEMAETMREVNPQLKSLGFLTRDYASFMSDYMEVEKNFASLDMMNREQEVQRAAALAQRFNDLSGVVGRTRDELVNSFVELSRDPNLNAALLGVGEDIRENIMVGISGLTEVVPVLSTSMAHLLQGTEGLDPLFRVISSRSGELSNAMRDLSIGVIDAEEFNHILYETATGADGEALRRQLGLEAQAGVEGAQDMLNMLTQAAQTLTPDAIADGRRMSEFNSNMNQFMDAINRIKIEVLSGFFESMEELMQSFFGENGERVAELNQYLRSFGKFVGNFVTGLLGVGETLDEVRDTLGGDLGISIRGTLEAFVKFLDNVDWEEVASGINAMKNIIFDMIKVIGGFLESALIVRDEAGDILPEETGERIATSIAGGLAAILVGPMVISAVAGALASGFTAMFASRIVASSVAGALSSGLGGAAAGAGTGAAARAGAAAAGTLLSRIIPALGVGYGFFAADTSDEGMGLEEGEGVSSDRLSTRLGSALTFGLTDGTWAMNAGRSVDERLMSMGLGALVSRSSRERINGQSDSMDILNQLVENSGIESVEALARFMEMMNNADLSDYASFRRTTSEIPADLIDDMIMIRRFLTNPDFESLGDDLEQLRMTERDRSSAEHMENRFSDMRDTVSEDMRDILLEMLNLQRNQQYQVPIRREID